VVGLAEDRERIRLPGSSRRAFIELVTGVGTSADAARKSACPTVFKPIW
jgi:hypothetical protein